MALVAPAVAGSAQTAHAVRRPTPLLANEKEPPRPLAAGRVFIQYRTENMRVLPVFGHVHITVDDASWHFVDTSGETVVLVGLPPGPHAVLTELADPTKKVVARETVRLQVPAR